MKHGNRMKFLTATIALGLFLGAIGTAKTQQPTLPPNTVLGRTGITPGPAQAIPFTTLATFLPVNTSGAIVVSVRSSSAATVAVSAASDYFLCLDPTSNAIAVNLPASPATGQTFLVKDCTGQAASHNITITPAVGNIDGIANFVMSTNFQSVGVTFTGSQWSLN